MRTSDQRTGGDQSVMLAAVAAMGTEIRVAIPGIVEAWDKDTQTVRVRPAIREIMSQNGQETEVGIPLLVDVPVVFPCAGGPEGYVLAITPVKGDECLVVFSDMCIDAWWQSGGVQSQSDRRRHDLSDGFAVLGVWSQPGKPVFPEEGCFLQNKKGTAGVSIKNTTVNVFGNVLINGQPYAEHTHSGVEAGEGNTGGVVIHE